jgi:hypothetical protein
MENIHKYYNLYFVALQISTASIAVEFLHTFLNLIPVFFNYESVI